MELFKRADCGECTTRPPRQKIDRAANFQAKLFEHIYKIPDMI